MKLLAKKQKFEEAQKIKSQIFALKHIQDIALFKENLTTNDRQPTTFRIEAYDVAHMSGKNVVGVMTVVENGEPDKSQYRKFKIHDDKNPARPNGRSGGDDTLNLKEVLTRRLAHPEWRFPDLIVVDGGVGQLNATREVLEKAGLNIDIVSVVKDEKHKAREILNSKGLTLTNSQGQTLENLEKSILLANSEAHRFALKFHRRLRGRNLGYN